MEDILRSLFALLPLESLPRTGWIQCGIANPEPIAGHLLGTAHLALALAPRVDPPLDVDRVVALATIHDAPEALTGDLPRSGAELLPEGAKRTAEARAAEIVLGGLHPVARERFLEFERGETREARLARLCDKLQLGLRLVAYTRAGQRGLSTFRGTLEELDCAEFAPAEELRRALLAALDRETGGRARG
jgi:putative hydrolase of HD superfamily